MFVIQVDIGVGTESMSEPLKSSLTVALTGSVPWWASTTCEAHVVGACRC